MIGVADVERAEGRVAPHAVEDDDSRARPGAPRSSRAGRRARPGCGSLPRVEGCSRRRDRASSSACRSRRSAISPSSSLAFGPSSATDAGRRLRGRLVGARRATSPARATSTSRWSRGTACRALRSPRSRRRFATTRCPAPRAASSSSSTRRRSSGRPRRSPGFDLNLNTGAGMPERIDFEPVPGETHWFAIDRSILAQSGVALHGPPAQDVFAALPRELLFPVLAEALRRAGTGGAAVLSACRTLRLIEGGVWESKPAAAAWMLARGEERALVEGRAQGPSRPRGDPRPGCGRALSRPGARRGSRPSRAARWRAASKSEIPAATLTFSDSTWPAERDREGVVAGLAHARPDPLPLRAEDEERAGGEVGRPDGVVASRGRGPRPEVAALRLVQVAREVDDDGDRDVLDRAGGGMADGGGDARRVVLGDDDARRAGPLGAAADRAEVVRVGHLVEADDQRPLAGGELPGVGVAVGLAEGDDALVVARPRLGGQRRLRPDLHPEPLDLAQPRLGAERALGDEELEDLRGAPLAATSRTGRRP